MTTPEIDSGLAGLLSDDVTLRPVEPHIYSVLGGVGNADPFEKHAAFYDLVICNPLYNRLMWGYSVKGYEALTRNALASSRGGWVLDAGCGSLAFNAETYLRNTGRPVVLLDRSLGLLRIARARLTKLNGRVPPNMVFLHADALQLPFKAKTFRTIIAMNLLHVLGDAKKALLGLRNVLAEGGTMTFTTLIESNRFADRYLRYLLMKTSGTVPRTAEELRSVFEGLSMPVRMDVKGSMVFIYCNI